MAVICPKCHYAFDAPEGARTVTCPNGACGHQWRMDTQTVWMALSVEGREACPELHVVAGEGLGRVIPLDAPTVLIGREPDCTIRLTSPAISRHHAEIVRTGDDCQIRDLGSRAGIRVNGRPVRQARLAAGDEILIAGTQFAFRLRYEPRKVGPAPVPVQDDGLVFQGRRPVRRVELAGDRVTLGRGLDRDVVIAHPLVSRHHALFRRDEAGWSVLDTRSQTGTFLNGKPVIEGRLERGDRVQMGAVAFVYDGTGLELQTGFDGVSLRAEDLRVEVAGGTTLLEDVSLSFPAGALVGLIGPSGAGKTTLLHALSGFRPPTAGRVLYNDVDLQTGFETLRQKIGYVPQDDIVHPELTPREALAFAARLRLPPDTSPEERQRSVDETLDVLGLSDRADLPIARLSGGQRKRVNVGVELLTKCTVLFLDEPCSGLDPATEARMMRLFRRLADQGRTVILTTHAMENIDLLDQVVVLYGGRLAWSGSPAGALEHFGCTRATEMYDRLEDRTPAGWAAQAPRPDAATREGPAAPDATAGTGNGGRKARRAGRLHQLRVLTARYARVTLADRRNLLLNLAQPVVIFLFICVTFSMAWQVLFLAEVSMFWVGCTNAAREIVRERGVLRRERTVGLSVASYLLSKLAVLTAVCVPQALVAVAFIKLLGGIPESALLYFVALFVAALSGTAMGLLVSAAVARAEHAQAIVPIVLVPQIIFAGQIQDVSDMNPFSQFVSTFVSTRWTHESLRQVFMGTGEVFLRDQGIVLGFAALSVLAAGLVLWLRREPE